MTGLKALLFICLGTGMLGQGISDVQTSKPFMAAVCFVGAAAWISNAMRAVSEKRAA